MLWVLFGVFLKGDKTCKRGNHSACTADIYTEQKVLVVVGKLRKKNCRGHVAYKLAGKRTEYERVDFKKIGEEISHNLNSRHITRENEEENERHKKPVINREKRASVKYKKS